MSSKFLKYILLTGLLLTFFIIVQNCNPNMTGNKTIYSDKLEIIHSDKKIDTINVVYYDYIYINEDRDLVKKNGVLISKNVKKFRYLSHEKTKL